MSCEKCKVRSAYQAQQDYVELCPLHAAAGEMLEALQLISKMSANPITEYGCESRGELFRHIDKIWQIAREAIELRKEIDNEIDNEECDKERDTRG